jgi:hypothetical protein
MRHLGVEQHDVRVQRRRQFGGTGGIAGLANDLDVALQREAGPQSLPDHGRMLDENE